MLRWKLTNRRLLLFWFVGVPLAVGHLRLALFKGAHALLVGGSDLRLIVAVLPGKLLVLTGGLLPGSLGVGSDSLALSFRNRFVASVLRFFIALAVSYSLGSQIGNESLAVV
jgi:hypothetical protein